MALSCGYELPLAIKLMFLGKNNTILLKFSPHTYIFLNY